MNECILCSSNNGLEYSITHTVFNDSLKAQRLWICRECWTHNVRIYWCPRCENGYTVDSKHPWVEKYATATPVVCRECSLSDNSAIVECDHDDCTSRLRPSKNITGRGRMYCATHWGEVQRCRANYCSMIFHRLDSGACVQREDHRSSVNGGKGYFCLTCLIPSIPPGFPLGHPNLWTPHFKLGCSCRTCEFLAGTGVDTWPDTIDHRREKVTCTECDYDGALDDMRQFFDGNMVICHTCFYNILVVCDSCNEKVLREMIHPIVRSGHPIPPSLTPRRTRFRPGSSTRTTTLQGTLTGAGSLPTPGGLVPLDPIILDPLTPPEGGVCDVCVRDEGKYRLCDVLCNAWFLAGDLCNCDGIHRWNYKPPIYIVQSGQSQRTDPTITPFLGFELEVETVGEQATRRRGSSLLRSITGEWAYAVHDGTLANDGQGGFEIVTHPFTFQWFNENWPTIEQLLEALAIGGYRSWEGGRCGMHVHISRTPMTEAHQMKFIQFIYGSANLAMCVGQRGPRDRGLTRFAPFDQEDRAQFLSGKIRGHVNPGAEGHYAALNANNPDTYEARWFRGTLQPKSFRKNVEFVHAVWTFTRKFGFTSSNEINFMEWLRGDPERRDYAMLLDFLEHHYITRR